MPNTMMGYGGVQPQRAATPAMPIRQDYAGPLPAGGGFLVPGGGNVRPPKDYAGPLPQGGGGLGRGVPLPPKLGGGMNYIGGSPNFDESIGAYRNPPAPPTLGITPIRGPFPFPTPRELNNGTISFPTPRELNNGTITAPRELNNGTIYAPRELNNGTISFPTQTPDQMQALRNAHLAQQQAQLLMAQQQPQQALPYIPPKLGNGSPNFDESLGAYRNSLKQQPQQALPYIPPNAGIAALPMDPAMMQRLGAIANLAGGVRR